MKYEYVILIISLFCGSPTNNAVSSSKPRAVTRKIRGDAVTDLGKYLNCNRNDSEVYGMYAHQTKLLVDLRQLVYWSTCTYCVIRYSYTSYSILVRVLILYQVHGQYRQVCVFELQISYFALNDLKNNSTNI